MTRRQAWRVRVAVMSLVTLIVPMLTGCVPWPRPLFDVAPGVPGSSSSVSREGPASGPHAGPTTPGTTPTALPTPTRVSNGPGTPTPTTPFIDLLNGLVTDKAPESHTGYDRDLFHVWVDADADGCNTRAEVLMAQSRVATTHHNRCTIDSGEWFSLYDGLTLTDASSVDIDHVVPLSEAWKSGAWQWTADTRRRYANDMGYAASLLAVSAASNRSKGDSDPAQWMPVASAACDYAQRWVAVKFRWSLTVDLAERSVLLTTLEGCSGVLWNIPAKAEVVTTE